jgi:nucleotide-binding universal stress UspA family protein
MFNMKALEIETQKDKSVSIKKVLVAVDLSDRSAATAWYAAQIARSFGASLTVVHVYQPVALCEYASETTCTVLDNERDQIQKMLAELARQVSVPDLVCKSAFLVGSPAEEITKLASDIHADLIVTACHHPTFLGGLFNLEKAPQIMHRAPCPVLVYHRKER